MRAVQQIFPFVVIALASGNAAAAKLSVTATVVPTCQLSVSVPKVGSEARARGGVGSFEVTCTHVGAVASGDGSTSRGATTRGMPRPRVHMIKGLVPHPKLESLAHAAGYEDMSVAEVLF